MDDTISRLAVIQIIEKMRARIGHNLERSVGRAMIEILDEVGKDVGMLPSAQPEIIQCKDCDWWTKQEDSPQGRCALLQMYPTGGWFCGNARRREATA